MPAGRGDQRFWPKEAPAVQEEHEDAADAHRSWRVGTGVTPRAARPLVSHDRGFVDGHELRTEGADIIW